MTTCSRLRSSDSLLYMRCLGKYIQFREKTYENIMVYILQLPSEFFNVSLKSKIPEGLKVEVIQVL